MSRTEVIITINTMIPNVSVVERLYCTFKSETIKE